MRSHAGLGRGIQEHFRTWAEWEGLLEISGELVGGPWEKRLGLGNTRTQRETLRGVTHGPA